MRPHTCFDANTFKILLTDHYLTTFSIEIGGLGSVNFKVKIAELDCFVLSVNFILTLFQRNSRSVMIPFHDFETALIRKVMPLKIPNMTTVCVRDIRQNSYQRACTSAQPCPSCISKRKWHWDHYLRHFKAGIKDSETFLRFYLGKSIRGHADQVPFSPIILLRRPY